MQRKEQKFSHIVITGASSGIGEALALHYARPGVRLGLTGQNEERLRDVATRCRAAGAQVDAVVLSVTDAAGMRDWLLKIDDARPVDLIYANAGISAGMGPRTDGETPEQVRKLFDVNVFGVFNTIEPLLPRMATRGRGNIGIVSSLAGFRGWPGAPAYCATKAAVRVYAESLRGVLAHKNIRIHAICPGFVISRMTNVNEFPMPFIMPADRAAAKIAAGVRRNKGRISFPFPVHFFMWLLMVMPDGMASSLLRGMPAKRALNVQ